MTHHPFLRSLVAVSLLVAALTVFAENPPCDFVLRRADGTSVSLSLGTLRSLTFSYSARTLTAHYADGTEAQHDYAAVTSLVFQEPTSVTPSVTEPSPVVTVYALDGTLLAEGPRETVTSSLAPGIYLVREESVTRKILVR